MTACCGLPVARKDHAVVMARFSRDIVRTTSQLTKKLELLLGPDTADLAMRVGLHRYVWMQSTCAAVQTNIYLLCFVFHYLKH